MVLIAALAIVGSAGAAAPSAAPAITSFQPARGGPGAVVTIVGDNFAGASVTFGTVEAQTVEVDGGATEIFATVPIGATTGPITVTTGEGSASTSGDFTVDQAPSTQPVGFVPPVLSSFTPASGKPGSTITVVGENFSLVTAVMFGGIKAKFYENLSPSILRVLVPVGAQSGKITVVTSGGHAMSTASFTVGTTAHARHKPAPRKKR
jgi:hypothetical protein